MASIAENTLPRRWRRSTLAALIVFAVTLALGAVASVITSEVRTSERKAQARVAAAYYAQRVDMHIDRALSATYALAAMVRLAKGRVVNFDSVAGELLKLYPDVSSLQLAPNGIITYVVPMQGNEPAVGHNLLVDEKRNKEAIAAMKSGRLTLAGPFGLIQGGTGAIGRLPIFLPREDGERVFWGFATALIRVPKLLDEARLSGLAEEGYRFQLWRVHPDTGAQHVIAASGGALESPVVHEFDVPNGKWNISVAPLEGWTSWGWIAAAAALSLLAGALAAGVAYFTFRDQPKMGLP